MNFSKEYSPSQIDNYSLGRGVGLQYITDAQGQINLKGDNKIAIIVQCLVETQLNTFVQDTESVSGSSLVQGTTLPAGCIIYGNTQRIQLASGLVCLYIVEEKDKYEYTAPNIFK